MNLTAVLFFLLTAILLLALPRRWAILPLLMGACYMTAAQRVAVGPFNFTVLRLLLLLVFVRAMARQERLPGGWIRMDSLLVVWGVWLVVASVFHNPVGETLVLHLGAAYNTLGMYFAVRLFCRDLEDVVQTIKITALVLVPVALEMLNERVTGRNLFAVFGGVPEAVMLRDGRLRAQGPFGHAILAGTVGAFVVPWLIGIWRQHPRLAKIGLLACLAMVYASTSSGPIMTVVMGLAALAFWPWRHWAGRLRGLAIAGYIALELIMDDPAYFVLTRIDLTGSSTGWHRAELIRQSINHLGEWWLYGTDYNRHWMPYGVSFSQNYCDVTNHYLFYGVWGGLPLMFLFIAVLWLAFRYAARSQVAHTAVHGVPSFTIWALTAGLFAQAFTCISVAFFEQSVLFLYLNIGVIGSLYATTVHATVASPVLSDTPAGEDRFTGRAPVAAGTVSP